MRSYKFTINMAPIAKARPKFRRARNGKVCTYTEKGTREAEDFVKMEVLQTYKDGPQQCPCMVTMTFKKSRPVDKKRLTSYPSRRPDIDNMAKLVMDALNGVIWEDDAQIVGLQAVKIWAQEGEEPGIILEVSMIE